MKYTKEILQDKKVKFTIDLTKEEWEQQVEKAYEHNKGKYNVQGFRKGKAPRKMIEKTYGASVFYDDAINHSFYDYYGEVLDKEPEVKAIGQPQLELKKLDESGVTMVIITEVVPEVELGAYTGLEIEKVDVKVSADEVKKELEEMQAKSARIVEVEREVKKTDIAVIDFEGFVDGKAFEGGKAENYELEIGSNTFIPGFEDQIIGMKKGEERDINVTFPENYHADNLKGKECVFKIKLHSVKEKQLPEINDEFASNVSEFETLQDYKKDIKKHLLEEKKKQADLERENKLLEKISENAKVEIPESMIDEQVEEYIKQFEYRLMYQGLKLEDYVQYMNTTVEELKKERRTDAEKTCKMRLTLEAITKKENIKVEQKDIDEKIAEIAKQVGKTTEEYKKNVNEHMLSHITNDILVDKLLKFLKENNNI